MGWCAVGEVQNVSSSPLDKTYLAGMWLTACGCSEKCGDDGDVDGPGVCKGLPVEKKPLVEIVMVPK